MTNLEPLTIRPTVDTAVFEALAGMMAASDPWKTLGMDGDDCRSGFEGPCKEVFTAGWKGELAGLAILQVCGTFNGYIQTVFVPEGFRRKGVGKRLLEFCEDRIHRASPNVFICVSTFNNEAFRLYREVGYTLVGVLKDFLKPGFDEYLLRKTIGPKLGYVPANQII